MADGKLHGKNGAIYIGGTKVANKNEWVLSMTREYADVTTFRDKNKVNAAGLMDISGTFRRFTKPPWRRLTAKLCPSGFLRRSVFFADDPNLKEIAAGRKYYNFRSDPLTYGCSDQREVL